MKNCKKCNQKKELTEFYSNKTTKDRLTAVCKTCDNARRSELTKKFKENYIENPLNLIKQELNED